MEYKVIKKFYDPFLQRRVMPNETIEIPKERLENYKPYIQYETAKVELVEEEKPIIDALKVTERPKKRRWGKWL